MDRVDTTEALARNRAARSVHGGEGADLGNLTVRERPIEPEVPAGRVPAPGVARRTGRGYVDSFGEGRVCVAAGCPTKLSRYNGRDVCAQHDGSRRT